MPSRGDTRKAEKTFPVVSRRLALARGKGTASASTGSNRPALIAHSAADLVVIGRRTELGTALFPVEPGDLAMRLGRSMLVVPSHVGTLDARRVVKRVARKAARAAANSFTGRSGRRAGGPAS